MELSPLKAMRLQSLNKAKTKPEPKPEGRSAPQETFTESGSKLHSAAPIPKSAPSKAEQAEIDEYASRYRGSSGLVLNPPGSKMDPQLKPMYDYLENMVERLAGDRLRKEGLHLRISLYSGEDINAFMGRHDRGMGEGTKPPAEGEEVSQKVKTPWAVRKYSGAGQDGKPLYELGWNLGNFSKLKYEEEIAFIVAHELNHLFENHLEPGHDMQGAGKRWLSSQAHEAVADHEAVKMMAKSGYNTEAVLVALGRLFQSQENAPDVDTLMQGLESGGSSHHHEGVRIALAQGQLELLRREDPSVRPGQPLTPIPKILTTKIEVKDVYRTQDLEEIQAGVDSLLVEHLNTDESIGWLSDGRFGAEAKETPKELAIIKKLSPTPAEFGSALVKGIDKLEKSASSSQSKIDAMLRLYLASTKILDYGRSPEFTEEGEAKLASFLQRHSMGELGWKAEPFLKKLAGDGKSDPENPRFLEQAFAHEVLLNKNLESTFAHLYTASAQWSRLLDGAPSMAMLNNTTGESDGIGYLTDIVGELAKEPTGPLAKVHQKNALEALRKLDFGEQVRAVSSDHMESGSMEFAHTASRLFGSKLKIKDQAFWQQAQDILAPTKNSFATFRDEYLLATLSGEGRAKESPDISDNVIWESFRTSQEVPFLPATEPKLNKKLLAYVTRVNSEPNFVHDRRGMGTRPLDVNAPLGRRLTGLLSSEAVSAGEKKEVFNFLMAAQPAKDSTAREGENAELFPPLTTYAKNLGAAGIMGLLNTEHHQNNGLFEQAATSQYGVEQPDFAGDGLAKFVDKVRAEDIERNYGGREGIRMLGSILPSLAAKELNTRVSVLTVLGADKDVSNTVAQEFNLSQFDSMLDSVSRARKRFEDLGVLTLGGGNSDISADASRFLMDILLAQPEKPGKQLDWFGRATRVLDLNPTALDGRAEYRDEIESRVMPHLDSLKDDKLRVWMGKEHMMSILKPENVASYLTRLVKTGGGAQDLAAQVQVLDQEFKLSEKYPEAYHLFSEALAEKVRMQPSEVDIVFPPDTRTTSEKADNLAGHVRGLSALVGLARNQETTDQIHLIDYLMGRREDQPSFLTDATTELESKVPMSEIVRHTRSRLQKEETATRVMVVNSFLAGPTSFLRRPGGKDQLVGHLLKDISPKHKKMAHRLAEALLDSQGRTDSLALAYVMGQRGEGEDGKLDEATVLSNLFDAYGVPGVKFKQYLAFTSEFSEFRDAFEEAQDSAMPLSYLDSVRLIDERFKGEWPEELKIDKIMGSGSVNVALRYNNPETEQKEVISIARGDIESATEYDFYRFNRFLKSLTNTPEDKESFGYLLGLSDVIRESVDLEMDKEGAMKMQQSVQPLYNQRVNGWNVRSVQAFKAENMALFMELAKGDTARRVSKKSPEVYQSAMQALSQVEMDSLLGIDQHRGAKPVPLHANPDFHDGQVLIDPETKSVTILDFGQAVPIKNEEREFAVDLLGIIGKVTSVGEALKILNEQSGVKTPIEKTELQELLKREDPMDAFVHILSLVGSRGGRVPIGSVHWIMGVHRQMSLGEKIGVGNDKMVRNLTLLRKVGGSLHTYNRLHLLKQSANRACNHVLKALGFGAAAEALEAQEP